MSAGQYRIASYSEEELISKIQCFIAEETWSDAISKQTHVTNSFKNYPTDANLLDLYDKITNK